MSKVNRISNGNGRHPMFDGHNRQWYNIVAKDNHATVFIYDEISWWGVNAQDFVSDFMAIDADTITVRINSPGGDVFDGIAIASAIRDHPATVTTQIDGWAASIASVIAIAGDAVVAGPNAFVMIHNPWTIAAGEAKDLRRTADLLDQIRDNLADAYTSKTGLDTPELLEMMAAETWMTAAEAKEKGFVDEVMEADGNKAKAAFSPADFANAPKAALQIETTEPEESPGTATAQTPAESMAAARNRRLALFEKMI